MYARICGILACLVSLMVDGCLCSCCCFSCLPDCLPDSQYIGQLVLCCTFVCLFECAVLAAAIQLVKFIRWGISVQMPSIYCLVDMINAVQGFNCVCPSMLLKWNCCCSCCPFYFFLFAVCCSFIVFVCLSLSVFALTWFLAAFSML